MLFICPVVIHNAGGIEVIKMHLPQNQLSLSLIGYKTIIGLTLMYFMTFSTGQEAVQKFFAAKSPKTTMFGAFYCAIIMCMYGFVPAIYGLVARAHFPNIDPNTALSVATINFAPPILAGIVLAALCAATMSSAAGDLIAASTILTQDIILQRLKTNISDNKIVLLNKLIIFLIGICAIFISLMNFGIIPLLIFAFTIRSTGPFASIIIGLFYTRATKLASLSSIITGSLSAIIWMLYNEPFGIMSIIFGSIISVVTFVGISEIQHKLNATE
jgi:SSS family solute:Na+ symporter